MTETPKYTGRQLALLRGEIEPESNDEWNYVQDHASDLLPIGSKDRKPVFKISGDDIEKSRIFDRGSTNAAHQSGAMDKKDDQPAKT